MSAGDNGFVLICASLVFIMTPGLAFFYGGLVRRKNIVNTIMACAGIMGLSVVMWILFGFSLAFGEDHGGFIGGLEYICLNGISFEEALSYAPSLSSITFVVFQMMFAMITPALITGSVAGRMKYKALFIFIALWSLLVYYPMANMVWGSGGFLAELGAVDFAGGNVVHISSGVSGLVLAILLGRRSGVEHRSYRVHNIPFVFLGAALLWFGWFGFNAGSALGANGLAAHAFLTSALASGTALLVWMITDIIKDGKPTLVGASTGLVVGLVAITLALAFVPVWAAIIIRAVVSPLCYFMMNFLKKKLKIDDALDAFWMPWHWRNLGIGLVTGLFAQSSINPAAQWNGLVFGDTQLFTAQLISILVTIGVAVAGTLNLHRDYQNLLQSFRVEHKEDWSAWMRRSMVSRPTRPLMA